MAVTRMLSGVCTAGFSSRPHPCSKLAWVRPVKEFGSLLLGDLKDSTNRVLQCGDVVELDLVRQRPDPPHSEDWITDFIYSRPRLLRRLEGAKRARFLANHLDQAPLDVLGPKPTRSLCLVRPDRWWANLTLDPYSNKYQARIGFSLQGARHETANSARGIPVTDLKWRALGRNWIGDRGGELAVDAAELQERLGATDVYLALGLGRSHEGKAWLLVIGVHTVPDYEADVEQTCDNLDNNCDGMTDEDGESLCDDNNACTLGTCKDGVCDYFDKDCDDGDPTTEEYCPEAMLLRPPDAVA